MNDENPQIIDSDYSGFVTEDDITVELCIYRLATEKDWSLEIVTDDSASIVWNEVFESDQAAHTEFHKTLAEQGMKSLITDVEDAQFPEL